MSKPFFLPINPMMRRSDVVVMIVGISLLLAFLLLSPASQAQTFNEQTLYSFSGGNTDGRFPSGDLVNIGGMLYDTTENGRDNDAGSLFSFDTSTHTVTSLVSFGAAVNRGKFPISGLLNVNGTLFGTTDGGGSASQGTIFSFVPATSTFTTRYSFQSTNGDGEVPGSGLLNVNGVLYGTTASGGSSGHGTVYSFDPAANTETILYSFGGGTDGANPGSRLISINGVLYGITFRGGTGNAGNGNGIIFSFDLTTHGEHILHTFTGSAINNDGQDPHSGLTLVQGILYGVTFLGGTQNKGTIYSINPNGTAYQTLYSFLNDGIDGQEPDYDLSNVNGVLYGTTQSGGTKNVGTIYSFDPATHAETILYSFQGGSDGQSPEGNLININGTFYGTAVEGGGSKSDGTLFSLTPVVPPTANADHGRTLINTTLITMAPGVLTNDNNGGQGPLTATLVTAVSHGGLTFNTDGSFTYFPSPGFVGTDSFTYRVANPTFQGNTTTCTLTVQAKAPLAVNDSGRTGFNTTLNIAAPGVLTNDNNGGSPTTAALVTNPTHGSINFHSDGSFQYIPTAGFLGTDSFTYKDSNTIGTSNTATCTLTIQARTPVAVNDHGTVNHNTTATFAAPAVLGNDNPGTNTGVTAAIVTNPTHGAIVFHSDGSFKYTPTIGFIGTDSFTYNDTNSVGTSNIATCTLTVQ